LAHHVFLSHATEDRDTALQVCAALEAEGIPCWIAPRDVQAGTDYAAAILEGIRTSDLVLILFSTHANTSPYVLREIERAVAHKRPVLALRIDDAAPSASIEYYVNVWRQVEATTGVEGRRDEIVAAVREAIATPPSTRGSRPGSTKRAAIMRRWSRRTWGIALASVLVLLAIGLGLGLGATRVGVDIVLTDGQVLWTELSPQGSSPGARYSQDMVQDPTSGRLILFGGCADESTVARANMNDTWGYDPTANTWTKLNPFGMSPPARGACTMAYDPATRRLVMFGGRDDAARLNDTWAFDPAGNTWTELSPAGPVPAGRGGHVMVYDPSSGRLIMFGGRSGESQFLNDTWAYDPVANTWTELAPTGLLPPARAQPAMAYDPAAHRMIVFGGWNLDNEFNDTWAYDPARNIWTELKPDRALPPKRCGHDFVYDPSRSLFIMFGGLTGPVRLPVCFNDTWAYDPAANTWTKLSVSSDAAPLPRAFQSMVFDPSSGRMIIFGGAPPELIQFNDTWACALQ
jgi:N-acetylneuraminic acid mutarotase